MKFLVVDDHELVRDGFSAVLSNQYPDLELIQAGSVAEGRLAIQGDDTFDLAILDMKLPDGEGTELIDELGIHHPEVPMIAISADYSYQDKVLQQGALGFLPKEADSDQILSAITTVLSGQIYTPHKLKQTDIASRRGLQRHAPQQQLQSLNSKQEEVLRLVMQGQPNRDIANQLGLAESTIKAYVGELLRVFKVTNRTQLVRLANDLALFTEPPSE